MSGPEPVLAATEALGCTSSSDSLVTVDLHAGRLGEVGDQLLERVLL